MDFHNNLECLSIESLSSLVQCLEVRLEPKLMRHLSDAPLMGRLLDLPTNIRLNRQYLPETNTLAYYENA
jgi:hypothetical protein